MGQRRFGLVIIFISVYAFDTNPASENTNTISVVGLHTAIVVVGVLNCHSLLPYTIRRGTHVLCEIPPQFIREINHGLNTISSIPHTSESGYPYETPRPPPTGVWNYLYEKNNLELTA